MAKVAKAQNQVSIIAISLSFSLCSLQAAIADCPWADTNFPVSPSAQMQDQYSNYQSSPKEQVKKTASSINVAGKYLAKAKLAPPAVGRQSLPATRLSSFVKDSGKRDDIYGMEGEINNTMYASIGSGFTAEPATVLSTGQPAKSTQN